MVSDGVRPDVHAVPLVPRSAFAGNPRPGEVYNLGGGRESAAYILECLRMLEDRRGWPVEWTCDEQARSADLLCYISDLSKLRRDYPSWRITRSLPSIVAEILEAELQRAPG